MEAGGRRGGGRVRKRNWHKKKTLSNDVNIYYFICSWVKRQRKILMSIESKENNKLLLKTGHFGLTKKMSRDHITYTNTNIDIKKR